MNAFIFEITGRTCSVNPFSSEIWILDNVPTVDGYIACDFQYSYQTYILIICNALYILTMKLNLIPTFLMKAGGFIVNYIPKIHCNDPTSSDHCI